MEMTIININKTDTYIPWLEKNDNRNDDDSDWASDGSFSSRETGRIRRAAFGPASPLHANNKGPRDHGSPVANAA